MTSARDLQRAEGLVVCSGPHGRSGLSDSTEREDRGLEFRDYRSIPGFREYLLVAQDIGLVEYYVYTERGVWTMQEAGPGQAITLASCQVDLRIDDLYLKVLPLSSQGG